MPIISTFRSLAVAKLTFAISLAAACASASAAFAADREFCLDRQGDDNIAACTRAIDAGTAHGGDLARLYLSRGVAHMDRFDVTAALDDINQAIRLDPTSAAARDARGRVYRLNPDRAILDYDAAIALDANYARAYAHRGTAYWVKSEPDRAVADFNQAIRLDPNDAQAYLGRGLAFQSAGRLDSALADFDDAIRLDPQNRLAYLDRGQIHQRNGNPDRAIADYDQAIKLGAISRVYVLRGMAYQAKGDIDRAVADYTESIKRNPDDAFSYRARGLARYAKGDRAGGNADVATARSLSTILGLTIRTFAGIHAIIGLFAIVAGAVVVFAMLRSRRYPRWAALFFAATGLTAASGFLFRGPHFGPAYPAGWITLTLVVMAMLALYVGRLAKYWLWTYVVATLAALYLTMFIGVRQSITEVPGVFNILPLDPTPVFLAGVFATLALFVVLGIFALWKYRPPTNARTA